MSSLVAWVRWVAAHPLKILGAIVVITFVAGWIAITQFRINSNLTDLIDQNAPWRADFDAFEAAFPDLVRTAVVVVSSESRLAVEDTTREILAYLNERPDLFRAVAAPGAQAFFRDHALLYMDVDDLDDTADRLAEAQPWLTAVADDPSLRSVFRLLMDALENDPPAGINRVLRLLNVSLEQRLQGVSGHIRWGDEFFESDGRHYQQIFLKAQSSTSRFEETLPDAAIVGALREMIAQLPHNGGGVADGLVSVKMTGELPLQHEEIEAAMTGVTTAGWLAVILLFLVLVVGVRSGKIIFATFTMLAIGVVWTSALAMLTVGEYNTLSVVFVVMFFGLGVDFALHYSLRFQEAVNAEVDGGDDVDILHNRQRIGAALAASTTSVGRAIALCTATTALGFLCFTPTDYRGLADLGMISAGGMIVAFVLTFTYLPACYAVLGAPRAHTMDMPTSDRIVHWLLDHRRAVLGVVLLATAAGLWAASLAKFDYSTLALKDPHAESMVTLRTLQREGLSTDYQLVVVSDGTVDKERLLALPSVDEVRTHLDYVPDEQEDKFYVIDDLHSLLWSALEPSETEPPPSVAALRPAVQELIEASAADTFSGQALDIEAVRRLGVQLERLTHADDDVWRAWQHDVIDNLIEELAWVRRALDVRSVQFEDLPETLRQRLVTPDGRTLTVIMPSEDIADVRALSRFIDEVKGVVGQATGRPVIEWGVGGIVTTSFIQALFFAIVAITLVLLITMKRIRNVWLILMPLLLTGIFALAFTVVFDQPINMANVLVLPLIFGLGVDNGIHVVDRYLGEGDVDHLMHSSTPRAVLLSTMTTIGAFAALSLSPHAGTASIGLLLTVAVGILLALTIFLLPVLLSAHAVNARV